MKLFTFQRVAEENAKKSMEHDMKAAEDRSTDEEKVSAIKVLAHNQSSCVILRNDLDNLNLLLLQKSLYVLLFLASNLSRLILITSVARMQLLGQIEMITLMMD